MNNYLRMTKPQLITRIKSLEKSAFRVRPPTGPSGAELQQLVHELKVHQIELESQNQELRQAEQLIEESRDRYADLYDFAPVGCVTLDYRGVIHEINLTGAGLLGVERSRLTGVPLHLYIVKRDSKTFRQHLRQCFGWNKAVSTELNLAVKGVGEFHVQLLSVPMQNQGHQSALCRTAITDITKLKQAEAQVRALNEGLEATVNQRTRELEEANRALRAEIAERRRVETTLIATKEGLVALSHRLLHGQETERQQLARELHDEIAQELTRMKWQVDLCLASPEKVLKEKLHQIPRGIGEILERVRALSTQLRPALLDDLGLLPTLRSYITDYTSRTQVEVHFKHDGLEGRRFPNEMETGVFRIVQEALTNVARHAGVKKATLDLQNGKQGLELRIADQGCGFNPTATTTVNEGNGLAGLRERAALLGGQLTVNSAPGRGTVVSARFSPVGASTSSHLAESERAPACAERSADL